MALPTFRDERGGVALLLVLAIAAVLVPVLNLAVPADSALHVPDYTVTLLGKYLCYALAAVALDLVWGYCGILSLGHGAFFALGGYAMGMYLMRQIGDRGVYGNPLLPDFMVFLNWQELPWYWHGFDHFAFALLMVVLVPGALAFAFGYLAFRSRVSGVYLSIITQALTFALMLAFFRNDMGFGGNNGLTDFKELLGFDLKAPGTRAALFVLSAAALAGGAAEGADLRSSARFQATLGQAGVDVRQEAVVFSGAGLTADAALAHLSLTRLGQARVSIYTDTMDAGIARGLEVTGEAHAAANKGAPSPAPRALAYPFKLRADLMVTDPASTRGVYPKVFIDAGRQRAARPPEGKLVSLPYGALINTDGTPKPVGVSTTPAGLAARRSSWPGSDFSVAAREIRMRPPSPRWRRRK